MNYMERNLHRRIFVGELARQVNLSYWHFVRVFQAECGVSPAHYHKHLRIRHGKQLRAQTFLSVKEIAAIVGMDESHFLRDFRRIFGVSPSRYRSSEPVSPRAAAQRNPQETAQTANQ
jgi:transcriptional regulator GlxA family with amidase domain